MTPELNCEYLELDDPAVFEQMTKTHGGEHEAHWRANWARTASEGKVLPLTAEFRISDVVPACCMERSERSGDVQGHRATVELAGYGGEGRVRNGTRAGGEC